MVTQQSWMFLQSYESLREIVIKNDTIRVVSHHGRYAFSEITNAVVQPVLVVFYRTFPSDENKISAFRLTAQRPAPEQARLLMDAISGRAKSIYFHSIQKNLSAIPSQPFVYWLRPRFFEIFRQNLTLGQYANVVAGLQTGVNEQFVRVYWEVRSYRL